VGGREKEWHLVGDVDDSGRCDVFASVNSSVQPDAPPVVVLASRTGIDLTQLQTESRNIAHFYLYSERTLKLTKLTACTQWLYTTHRRNYYD